MNKQEALEKLSKLDENILVKMAQLSDSSKAKSYFTNPILWATLKGFLNVK